ncbi:hypothetical protein [Rufibacter ruber]|uniref:hypothetical protein n=1 Tax=Rufibacter ruber TaxID=1783499 RepID=UPI0008361E0F|nr:hypothetical protein [Rufibacter ruber]
MRYYVEKKIKKVDDYNFDGCIRMLMSFIAQTSTDDLSSQGYRYLEGWELDLAREYRAHRHKLLWKGMDHYDFINSFLMAKRVEDRKRKIDVALNSKDSEVW